MSEIRGKGKRKSDGEKRLERSASGGSENLKKRGLGEKKEKKKRGAIALK